jgi:hypothetical protein
VNAEFQWWLLILGIVIGGALVYLVLADLHDDRDEEDVEAEAGGQAEVGADDRPLAEEPGAGSDEATPWSPPADSAPVDSAQGDPSVPGDPAPADERGRPSVGDDPTVQRDGAERETSVADLP